MAYLNTSVLSKELIPPHVNFSHLTTQDYAEMYAVIKAVKEDNFAELGLDPCVLEDELNKVSDVLFLDRRCPHLTSNIGTKKIKGRKSRFDILRLYPTCSKHFIQSLSVIVLVCQVTFISIALNHKRSQRASHAHKLRC